ncbi:MAG: branched-chain amino acid ABC transporter permease [Pseudomonadota bacterium]|nr:branched-chain amino acid ABC transporter permease [Pseudomonadota bacterium]
MASTPAELAVEPVARRSVVGRVALAGALLALALFPFAQAAFYTELVTKVMILAIFAMSLDLLVGYTGMVSFGHAAYFGIGAYTLGLLAPKYDAASLWTTLPLAVVFAGLAAWVVALLVVRVRGIYFIMVTLAFAQMFYFVFHDTNFGRGSDGISINYKPTAAIGGFTPVDLSSAVQGYYFVFVIMLLVFGFLRLLLRSPLGHALQGIRSNEHRMQSLGFPVYRYKVASFTIAGALAGLAGFLSTMQFGFVNPEMLSWHQSGNVLLMLILGGVGSLYGGVIGAFVFVALQEIFSSLTTHWQLLLGATIILLVMFLPGGLSSVNARLRGRVRREQRDE